jgi:cell division protein FtsB
VIIIATPSNAKTIRLRKQAPRRLITLLCFIPLTCLAFTWIGVRASGAYFTARDMRKDNDMMERRYLMLKQQNDRVEREVKAFQTPTGIVRAARRLGWVKPGEVHLHVP